MNFSCSLWAVPNLEKNQFDGQWWRQADSDKDGGGQRTKETTPEQAARIPPIRTRRSQDHGCSSPSAGSAAKSLATFDFLPRAATQFQCPRDVSSHARSGQTDHSHLVSKTAREEGRQPSAGPAVNVDDEGGLDPISLRDEDQVILRLECDLNAGESSDSKIVLRPVFIDHYPLLHQGRTNKLLM